ncbi:sulfotransferase family protein [Nocardioides mangrovi]|uniref:Sulfotransferase family protein n=1 Tax=Nocardioides mangrovi TaxID=2874580 RepID=A0ABS7UE10_9ACTN|nr:sulfotransferase family protein [Nocardioides mangrovi]MBZ5739238.1 sulfotransferase family protein [Nocardioides mangrovi]
MSAPDPTPTGTGPGLTLVAGAGRSGTSTVVGLLRRLGLTVPSPEVAVDETNPKGFGEPRWVVDFHDELLKRCRVEVSDARPEAWTMAAALGRETDVADRLRTWLGDELAHGEHVVVKDPRLLWFLPLWTATSTELGVEPTFLTMLRPPAEVVGSKRTYYNRGLDDAHGVSAWLNMMLGTERATRGSRRTFVRYHDLLDDCEATLGRVVADLALPVDATLPDGLAGPGGFVDPTLRRVRLEWSDLDLPDTIAELAHETWDRLDELAGPTAPADDGADRLDQARASYAKTYRQAEAIARSSIRAARREGRREGRQGQQKQADAATPVTADTTPSLLRRAARRVRRGR